MEKSRIIALLLCLGLSVEAWAQGGCLLRFAEAEQTVDTVRFDGGAITLRYPFENVSGKQVTILDIHSTCGCFTGEVASRTLAPGAKAVLTAVFDPKSLYGPQTRHITVLSTDGSDDGIMSSITVKGYVLRDTSEGEIRYPEALGEGLRSDAPFAWITKDSFADFVFSFPLYNDTDSEMKIEVSAPSRVKLYAPAVIGPRSREDLRGEYDALWKRIGSKVEETLILKVNGVEVTPLQIRGTIK